MGRVYDPSGSAWTKVGRQGAVLVSGHELLALGEGGPTRIALTRIEPGGVFGPHVDEYAHVFCVLAGRGEVSVGKQRSPVSRGMVILTDIREPHGLWAAPDEELVLVSANVYPKGEPAPRA
ncbi:MAG: cupin domain-containing protein [Acidimicrobiales bacterium]